MSNSSPHSQPAAEPGATAESSATTEPTTSASPASLPIPTAEPPPSYVKLAMRNMVKKGGKSLYHFALTMVGLLALLVGLAYLTH